jgi:hypothetical protein
MHTLSVASPYTIVHASIRLRYAAYLGWKTNSQRACARLNNSTSGAGLVLQAGQPGRIEAREPEAVGDEPDALIGPG